MNENLIPPLLQGYWFSGKTSARIAAELHIDSVGEMSVVCLADNALLQTCSFKAIRVSSRIGNTPRHLYFPAGEKFETTDNAQVDLLLEKYHPSCRNSLAHQLESHLYVVCATLVLLLGLSWFGVKYGLPMASKSIAYRLPQSAMNLASTETLKLLDKIHLKPTKLDADVQARVLQDFAPALAENADLHVSVFFRDGGDVGANAFALPDGTIIFTDEMVTLAKDDNELVAVLAHEIGHVKYRHGLRAAIQSSSLGFLVSMLMGDMSAASSMLTTLPLILTTMSYSRDFEREADQNALEYLDAHQIKRHVFVDLMERVTYETHCDLLLAEQHRVEKKELSESTAETTLENTKAEDTPGKPPVSKIPLNEEQQAARKVQCDKLIAEHASEQSTMMDYFSTHPATEERLQKFKH